MGEFFFSTGSFLLVITVLVFFHELGHYCVARFYGVKVEVFSVGFGPELFGWRDSHGTRWRFSLIPLGGYVNMCGQEEESTLPGSFSQKPLLHRVWIVAAGPLANLVLSMFLLWGLYFFSGKAEPIEGPPQIARVQSGTPADLGGLQAGDVLESLDGISLLSFPQLVQEVRLRPEQEVTISFFREEESRSVTLRLAGVMESGEKVGKLGIFPVLRSELQPLGFFASMVAGVHDTFLLIFLTGESLADMLSGNKNMDELGGPLRIAQLSGEMAEQGFSELVWFCALLSVNLGLINLFPIPLLDGGHLLFYALEAIRRKPLSMRIRGYCQTFGIAFVMGLFLFVIWNDLERIDFFASFFRFFS